MLRITTIQNEDAPAVLKLEGKLLEPWIGELDEACRRVSARAAIRDARPGGHFVCRRAGDDRAAKSASARDAACGLLAARRRTAQGERTMIMQVRPSRLSAERRLSTVPTSRCETARLTHQREVQQLARLRSTNHAACELLVQEYSGRLLAVARRMLRSEEDAADAVQDAFLAAFVSLHRFRGQAQVSTWLHRIVVNQCLMKLRSQKRRATQSLDALGSDFDELNGSAQFVAPWCDEVAAQLDQAESRAAVRRCIQQLSEDYREILILRDIEEFDTDQTAALLGLSRSAAKTRLHRARQALRAALEKNEFAIA